TSLVRPYNGILEWALTAPIATPHSLTEDRYFRRPVSRTFHGRDVFAPVAAHLASGVKLTALGPAIRDPVRLRPVPALMVGNQVEGCVRFIDRFGNALTNITETALAQAFPGVPENGLEIAVASWVIPGIARSYG